MEKLDRFRWFFFAAAVYNAVWGLAVSVFPFFIFDLCRIARPGQPWLMQCIGMIVGVYAIGYWFVSRDPRRYGAFVWVGLAGKVLGPVGFLFGAVSGEIPWSFGWVNVFNDLIWLPGFVVFLVEWMRLEKADNNQSTH